MYAQDPFSLPTDLPLLLSLSLRNLTHLSCWQVPVCNMSNGMMWGTMRHKVQQQHSTSEAKGLSGTLSCSTPPIFFLFKKTIATFEFEVLAPMGDDWGLSIIPFDGGGHATIAGLHPLLHFSDYQVVVGTLSDLNVFHFLFLYNGSPLIAVMTQWSCHLFCWPLKGVGLPMLLIPDWSVWCWRWSSDVSPFV
jgi:hypothetical protein